MPTKKEGERGRDQHLDVEILPPRVTLCIRKIKAVGKEHLPPLLGEATEACRSTAGKGECGAQGSSSATVINTHA